MNPFRLFVALLLCTFALEASSQTRLLMAEEPGCYWCARWNAEIAETYPKTSEGEAAPLVRFDIRNGPPDSVTFKYAVRYTPTFVLTQDGAEIGRIEGYPGEDFFWGILGQLLQEVAQSPAKSG